MNAQTTAERVATAVPSQTIEAEDGAFDGKIDDRYPGFSGRGFVDGRNAVGAPVDIEFGAKTSGVETLRIRYAHGKTDERPAELRVNGVVVAPALAFPPTDAMMAWQTLSIEVPLRAGANRVRLAALGVGGLANLDHFEITGVPQFKLSTSGTVHVSPASESGYYDPGTRVTLTAVPPTDARFAGWTGALSGAENPTVMVMDANQSVAATFDRATAREIHVSPTGDDSHPGTKDAPLRSIAVAVAAVFPGDTIFLRGGTYVSTATIVIDKAGTPERPIRLEAFPGERPVLDGSTWKPTDEHARAAARGIFLAGGAQWWILKGLEICHAPDNAIKSEGGHITFECCVFHHNGDSGLQIGLAKGFLKANPDPEKFAAYNLVLNCDSYRNADPATRFENADGFACKLHAGKGNRFVGCRAWENADDGWDFYLTSHEIVLERCWSWHNGDPSFWGLTSFQGDGNGFKLGGDNTFCPVTLVGCVAFDCQWGTAAGFAYNNNTAPFTLLHCLAVNCGKPYKLRQPGNTLRNCVDVNALKPAPRDIATPSTQENNSWNLALVVKPDDFVSLSAADAGAPREADGGLPANGFARLAAGSRLIDRGLPVGREFAGAAPDLGPYEASTPPPAATLP